MNYEITDEKIRFIDSSLLLLRITFHNCIKTHDLTHINETHDWKLF